MNPKSLLFGLAVGDALGVPVEFQRREHLRRYPVEGMRGHGTHNQPPGTWSDDTALALCLADALSEDSFSLEDLAEKFVRWHQEGLHTARGHAFDIGGTTRAALGNLADGATPRESGPTSEDSNGNGALMRIAPLVFAAGGIGYTRRFEMVRDVASITHGHTRNVVSCFYLVEYLHLLMSCRDKMEAYYELMKWFHVYFSDPGIPRPELQHLERLLAVGFNDLPESEIQSTGYVIHTLEASMWCLLTTDTYRDAVLKAVNLGGDTDTTGAVTGALAGMLYGYDAIPSEWTRALARKDHIASIAARLESPLSVPA